MTTLSDIATEAFIHRLVPMQQEVTLPAMHAFGEPPPIAIAAAIVAALAGAVILYLIGIWLRRMPKKISTEEQRARIEKLRAVAMEWLPWLLILSPTPVGGLLIIAAGFFAIRPWLAAVVITVAEVAWRLSPLL